MAIIDLEYYKNKLEYLGFNERKFSKLVNSITKNFSSSTCEDFNSYIFSRLWVSYSEYIEKLISSGAFNYFLNEYLFQNYDGSNLTEVLNHFFDIIGYYPNLSVAKGIVLKSVDLQKLFNCYHDEFEINGIALIKAIDRFDFTRGTKFSTYAYRCIINSLYQYYGEVAYPFSVPLNIHSLIHKYEKLSYQYESECKKLKDDVTCDILGITSKELELIKNKLSCY